MTNRTDSAFTTSPSAEEATLADLARLLRRSVELGLHVGMPGTVKTFTAPAGGKPAIAQVQPDLKAAWVDHKGAEDVRNLPPCHAIVSYPAFGGFHLAAELTPGETGWLHFSDRSLELWLKGGGPTDPVFSHTHKLTDAVFVPGLRSGKNAFTLPTAGKVWLGKDDGTLGLELDSLAQTALLLTPGEAKVDAASFKLKTGTDLGTFLLTLHTAVTAWTPVMADGGAALKASLTAWLALTPPGP